MAVIKAVSSSGSIGAAIGYVTKSEKTDVKLLSGIDCAPETARQEMQTTKEFWGKTDGRSYLSFVQSFHAEEKLSPKVAHEIGIRLAEKMSGEGNPWEGHEILIATHIDRGHFHTHFIVNSVSMEDGHKIQFSKSDLAAMKQWSDDLCREYGLTITEKGKTFHGEDRGIEQPTAYTKEMQYIMDQAKAGKVDSYIMEIAKAAVEVRSTAASREDFCQQMADRGYTVNWSDTRKNITFTDVAREMHGEKKCKVRDSNLEKTFPALQFSKESLILAFERNASKEEIAATIEQKQDVFAEPVQQPQEAAPEAHKPEPDTEPLVVSVAQKAQETAPEAREPEPEREFRPAAPVAQKPSKKPSEQLKAAFEDFEKAQRKVGSARYEWNMADELPFWNREKKAKKEAANQKLEAARSECAAAFDRVVSYGVSTYRDGVELSGSELGLGDMKYLSDLVDRKIVEMERSEAYDKKMRSKVASLDERIAQSKEKQQEQESQKQESVEISRKSSSRER